MNELSDRFARIRAYYSTVRVNFNRGDLWPGDDPYGWDRPHTGIQLTPIEWAMWQELRAEDVVMVPQYPVGKHFVDFANPAEKVAIECDGAAFHTDRAKDAHRQRALEAQGWTVYRISGSDCVSQRDAGERRNPARLLAKTIGDRFDIRHCCRGKSTDAGPVHILEILRSL